MKAGEGIAEHGRRSPRLEVRVSFRNGMIYAIVFVSIRMFRMLVILYIVPNRRDIRIAYIF